jgi:hypothetical protein
MELTMSAIHPRNDGWRPKYLFLWWRNEQDLHLGGDSQRGAENDAMKDTTSGSGQPTQSDERVEAAATSPEAGRSVLSKVAAFFVFLFERVMPDPFVFAIILTILAVLLAYTLVNAATLRAIAQAWYNGILAIFTFAFTAKWAIPAGTQQNLPLFLDAPNHRLLLTKTTTRP